MNTNKRHKHYDVIVAAAEGKDVQRMLLGEWFDFQGCEAIAVLSWFEGDQYRIKPALVEKWRFTVCMDDYLFSTNNHYKSEEEVLSHYNSLNPKHLSLWAVPLEPTKIVVEE